MRIYETEMKLTAFKTARLRDPGKQLIPFIRNGYRYCKIV